MRIKELARDWRVKVSVQNMIGLLPKPYSFNINNKLVEFVRGDIHDRQDPHARIEKGLKNISLIDEKYDFEWTGKNVLEWGTGWHGIDLIIFYSLKSNRIVTLDQHRNLEWKNFKEEVVKFRNYVDREEVDKSKLDIDRLRQLEEWVEKLNSLDEIFKMMNVDYIICDHFGDDKKLRDYGDSIDIFYSESVLQRIPQDKLVSSLRYVGSNMMKQESIFFHRTDQKDINAQDHVDERLWSFEYLKYSDFIFNNFISGPFNSQNRMRESDFVNVINSCGMGIDYIYSYYSRCDLERIRDFDVSVRFAEKSDLDLAVGSSKLLGRRGECKEVQDRKLIER